MVSVVVFRGCDGGSFGWFGKWVGVGWLCGGCGI